MAALDNQESMTAIEAINADGDVLAPMLVIQGSQLLAHYFINLPDQYCITTSNISYIND